MNLIRNSEIIEEACSHFVEPHPCLYNFQAEIAPLLVNYPNLSLQHQDITTSLQIGNKSLTNNIRLNFIQNSKNMENCLVYLHGLSSYGLEGKFLVPLLGENLSLCLFDSRAHGKNKAKFVTYGLLESEELSQILSNIRHQGFKNIILWGRSMGAVTALRFLQQQKCKQLIDSIKYVVADAPFSSFKSIATDIVARITHLPDFLSSVLADQFAEKIKEKFGLDLKEIDVEALNTPVSVNFLYSSKDELMGEKHIKTILKGFRGDYEENDIMVSHNDQRPGWVLSKIMANIRQKLKKQFSSPLCLTKRRGLSITKYYQDRLTFSKTPTPFSNYETKEPDPIKNGKLHLSVHREVKNNFKESRHNFGGYLKQNNPVCRPSKDIKSLLRNSQADFHGELGGSKINLISSRMGTYKNSRKITISQFFDQSSS